MRGIILAAGKGGRLNGTAGERPKCLMEVGGLSLVERQVRTLRSAGINEIVIVVGCQAAAVRQACGQTITYVENARYSETNSLYSLWMARPLLFEGFVVLNCDVLFHPALLHDLLASRHENALLLEYCEANQPPLGAEEMKVKVRGGRVLEMSKAMHPTEADGENLGIVKFGARGAAALVEIMDGIVGSGSVRDWAPRAFSEFAQRHPLHAVGTHGYPWIEIDFPQDYRRAVMEVLPRIERMLEDDADGPEAPGETACSTGGPQ